MNQMRKGSGMNQVRWVTAALALAALLEASGPARFAAASGVGGARAGAPRPWLEGLAWVNTRPLTRADLAGKVVVVEFWTFDCINCRRTVPAMKRLEQEYRGASDVAIVGIHTPELEHERDAGNVRRAVVGLGGGGKGARALRARVRSLPALSRGLRSGARAGPQRPSLLARMEPDRARGRPVLDGSDRPLPRGDGGPPRAGHGAGGDDPPFHAAALARREGRLGVRRHRAPIRAIRGARGRGVPGARALVGHA